MCTPGSGGGLNYSSSDNPPPPPRDPDSGQFLSPCEVRFSTGDATHHTDGDDRVSMRTVYKGKDLQTKSGN
jgi:hypothetical protein